jgi:hypothetical protein
VHELAVAPAEVRELKAQLQALLPRPKLDVKVGQRLLSTHNRDVPREVQTARRTGLDTLQVNSAAIQGRSKTDLSAQQNEAKLSTASD